MVAFLVVAALVDLVDAELLDLDSSAPGIVGAEDVGAAATVVGLALVDGLADATIDALTGAAGLAEDAGTGSDPARLDVNGEMGKASGATTATPTPVVANAIVTTVSFAGTARPPNHAPASRTTMRIPPNPLIRACPPRLCFLTPVVGASHVCTPDNLPQALANLWVAQPGHGRSERPLTRSGPKEERHQTVVR